MKSSKIGRPDWTASEPAVEVICLKSYLKYDSLRWRAVGRLKAGQSQAEIPSGSKMVSRSVMESIPNKWYRHQEGRPRLPQSTDICTGSLLGIIPLAAHHAISTGNVDVATFAQLAISTDGSSMLVSCTALLKMTISVKVHYSHKRVQVIVNDVEVSCAVPNSVRRYIKGFNAPQ
ncbi:hypothetical protein TNCV_2362211 [Trichonephila clavipes]|nr:hypothetical protein TNCV_2362211 [Trichonephila clavipes]